jgi:hypothetical protein
MAYVPGVDQDLFLSYDHADALWLSYFQNALEAGLRERLGEPVSIWRDTQELRLGQLWQSEIKSGISRSAAFLALISPSYSKSAWCHREVSHFFKDPGVLSFKAADRLQRFLRVIKAPADDGSHRDLRGTQQVEFFQRGDRRNGDLIFGPETSEFRLKMQETVTGLSALLRSLRRSCQAVFTATPADDALEDWGSLRDELRAQGFDLRPEGPRDPYTFTEDFVRQEIEEAILAVFLVKQDFDPFVELQLKFVRQLNVPAVFWLPPPSTTIRDPLQQRFVEDIRSGRNNPPGSSIIETPTIRGMNQNLKQILLAPRLPPPPEKTEKPTVYLLYDDTSEKDTPLASSVRNSLAGANLEVVETASSTAATSTERLQRHRKLLRECDGILLCRAAGPDPDQWLYQTVPEVLFAESQLNRPPVASKAFLLGRPDFWGGIPNVIPLREHLTAELFEPFLAPLRGNHASP